MFANSRHTPGDSACGLPGWLGEPAVSNRLFPFADGQAAQPLRQRGERASSASGGELAPSAASQGQSGEGILQVRLWICPLQERKLAPEELPASSWCSVF